LFACLGIAPAFAQDAQAPGFNDELLGRMAGSWKMEGVLLGKNATHSVHAQWVLNRQFLQIHEKDTAPAASGAVPYEAIVMVGWDAPSERYVAHWIDIYGGRVSETLGYGVRSGDRIEFVFEYPDGPFHTTFQWLPERGTWQWLMRTKDKLGHWTDFANLTLRRSSQ
jgi:hypothetical protein